MRLGSLPVTLLSTLVLAACPGGPADGPLADAGESDGGDGDGNEDGGTDEPVACLEAREGDPCAGAESCLQCGQAGSTCGGCSSAMCQSGSWVVFPPPPSCPCGGFVLADRLGQACTAEGETCKETEESCDAARCVEGTWTAVDVTAFDRCGEGPACGDVTCAWYEYCFSVLPGTPEGQTSYTCTDGRTSCGGDRPTCECLACADCIENDAGATCTTAAP